MSAKVAVLLILISTTGCGMSVDDQKDDVATSNSGDNQLVLNADGGYPVELTSSDVSCQRLDDDDTLQVHFINPTGPDAGLEVALTVAGSYASGDQITTAASAADRYFDFRLTTPAGESYRYLSTAPAAGDGTLTMIKSKDWDESADFNLSGVAANAGSAPINVQGSFACSDW